jgi:hypothetical protein
VSGDVRTDLGTELWVAGDPHPPCSEEHPATPRAQLALHAAKLAGLCVPSHSQEGAQADRQTHTHVQISNAGPVVDRLRNRTGPEGTRKTGTHLGRGSTERKWGGHILSSGGFGVKCKEERTQNLKSERRQGPGLAME